MKVVRHNAITYYDTEMRSIYGKEYDRHTDHDH